MGRIFKQGSEYVEKAEDGAKEASESEGDKKIPHKFLIIGFTAVALVLLALAVLSPKLKGSGDAVKQETDQTLGADDEYWEQFEESFVYSDTEKRQLRAWGYTGDDIENAQMNKTPALDLINDAKAAQEEARLQLSNPESPEYRALLNNTWLGQSPISLPQYEEGVTEGAVSYGRVTLNADYEKVPAHGHNLFLKVYLDDGSYAFMECPVIRYMQLAEKGNIVVAYATSTVNGVTIISGMTEIDVE